MKKESQKDARKDVLSLVLMHRWYDLIASDEKKEEYRELSPYWIRRLVEPVDGSWKDGVPSPSRLLQGLQEGHYRFRMFRWVRFFRGYTSTWLMLSFLGIRIGTGRPEWGATSGKLYFVIALS